MINKNKKSKAMRPSIVFGALKAKLYAERSMSELLNKTAGDLYNLNVAGLERTLKTGKLNKFSKALLENRVAALKKYCALYGARISSVCLKEDLSEIKAIERFLKSKSKPISK